MSRKASFAFVFCAAIFLAPLHAHAQEEVEISFEPTFRAEHAGFSLYDGNPVDPYVFPDEVTIRSSELTSVDGEWTVTGLTLWFHDVPEERGVYMLARVGADSFVLDGAPARGDNYDLAHAAFSSSATSTHHFTLSMPFFGDAATPSGRYLFFAAELPETKTVYDETTRGETTSPYTDDDLAAWLADPSAPDTVSPNVSTTDVVIEYINDGPPPCTEDCFSNVLFLPGVKASRLYRPQVVGAEENKLWEPGGNHDIEDLFLNTDGTSVRDDVYTRDILDAHFSFGNGDVYKAFSDFMNDEVEAGTIDAWTSAPYDWRLALDDILESGAQTEDGISYLTATDTPYIIQQLENLAATSKSGKVTIIGHSNGGLVAKALMNKLAEMGEENLVDKIIFVGVPQTGTPKAIGTLLHGYDESLGFGLITKTSTARTLAENLPAAYNLLPSEEYFADVATSPVEFSEDATAAAFRSAYGDTVDSYAELHDFLLGTDGRTKPNADDTDAPNVLNSALLAEAEALHTDLDAWEPPDGVELYEIAGVGLETPASFRYVDSCTFCLFGDPHVVMEPETVLEGDGTVVEASAHAGMGTKYYFNIPDYNRSNTRVNHGSVMGASDITSFLGKIISEDTALLPATITTTAPSFANNKHLVYRVHSPVSLDIYDASGNHTGMATTTLSDGTEVNYFENNVQGTSYDQFGEVQYIFSDGSTSITVILNGQGSGTATFDISSMTGNAVTASTTFVNIPVTPQTRITMTMAFGGSLAGASDLLVDEDGDGEVDVTLPFISGGVVMYEDFVVSDEEEDVPDTPAPEPQSSGGGGGGGGNGPIVTITAVATSTSTSTPETMIIATATSSAEIATTSLQEVEPEVVVAKTVTVVPAKKVVVVQQDNPATNNVKLVAGAAASLPAPTTSPTGEKWWVRIYRVFRGVIKSIIGL